MKSPPSNARQPRDDETMERYLRDRLLLDFDIQQYPETRELQILWQMGQSGKQGEPDPNEQAKSRIAEYHHNAKILMLNVLSGLEIAIRNKICIELQYAEMKKRHKSELAICKALFDGFVSVQIKFPIPLSMAICYIVQDKYLDRLCKCAD